MKVVIKLTDNDLARLSCGCEVFIPFRNNSTNSHNIEAIVIKKPIDFNEKGDT